MQKCGRSLVWSVFVLLMFLGSPAMPSAQGVEPTPKTFERHTPHIGGALNRCALHIARGEYNDARVDCDVAVDQTPDNPRVYANRGSLNFLVHDFTKAVADFDCALKLSPNDATLHFNRGLALAKLGRMQDAIARYTIATDLKSDFAIAFYNRGYECEHLGQRDHAIADYRRALIADPGLLQAQQAIIRLERQL